MSNILIVEDEPNMRQGLKDNLEFEGHTVDLAEDGDAGLEKIQTNNYDLVLLDVMLPKVSGFDVCKKVRKNGLEIPIILLTAKGEEIDKVLGLELGADDYITKPFSLRELMARIKAVLRRTKQPEVNGDEVTIGRLTVNFLNYTAVHDDTPEKLSHKEFEILKYLLDRKNQTVSRADLLENVWGYEEQPTTRTVDNFILKLRQKTEENPNDPKIILTVHGVGYKMISK
ncbi:MAG: response regulator transcription factor [Bacteroidota bacterium]